jgi:hypothetical protein
MNKELKMQILKQEQDRYFKSSKKEKGRILDNICDLCKFSRKHAIKRFAVPFVSKSDRILYSPKRKKRFKYSNDLFSVIAQVWRAFNYPCGPKLKAIFFASSSHIKNKFSLSHDTFLTIANISPSTLDRRLKDLTRSNKKKFANCTRSGRYLKNSIPIISDHSLPKQQGSCSIDLVVHCGDNNYGDCGYSLNFTDHFSGWTSSFAFIGKSQQNTVIALSNIFPSLPFNVLSINSDNGSEFINHHLYSFCRDRNIAFTRSREYKKNDNAYIEQKNFTHIRKVLGYLRYDSPHIIALINKLYKDLNIFNNLFVPSTKLISKHRLASKSFRKYDSYKTPFQRLLDSKSSNSNPTIVSHYHSILNSVDPFDLSESISQQIDKIVSLASTFKSNYKLLRNL